MKMQNDFTADFFDKDDPEAFKEVCRRNTKPLIFFAYKFIENQPEAEDIVANVISNFYENKKNDFTSFKAIKSYLYIATHTSCINFVKKDSRHRTIKNNLPQWRFTSPAEDIEQKMIKSEALDRFYTEVEKLPRQCRLIFNMYLQEKKPVEIAKELGLSVNTVRKQKDRAIKKLKTCLSPGMFPDFLL